MSTLATLVVKLVGDIGGYVNKLSDAEAASEKSGSAIASKLGAGLATVGKLTAGVAVSGIMAVSGAMIGGVTAANDWAGTLDSIGDVLGTSANDSAAMAVAIRGVGGDVDALTGQFAKLATGVFDSKGGLSTSGQAMEKLGIQFLDANGKLLPTMDLVRNISDRFAEMPDGLEKTDAMMALFGKSGKDMGDTLNALANGGLDAARTKAEALGLTIGDDGVNRTLAMNRSLEDLRMVGQGLAVSLGSQLLPVIVPLIQMFANWAISVMPTVRDAISRIGVVLTALVQGVTEGTGPFAEFGAFVREVFSTVGRVIGDVVAWVTAHWPEIQAVVGAVFKAIGAVIDNVLVPVLEFLIGIIGEVVAWVQENWPLIQQTAETVFNAIKSVIDVVAPILIDVLGGAFASIKGLIEGALGFILGIIQGVMRAINGDWAGAWESVRGSVERLWDGIVAFFNGLPAQLVQFGANLIDGLVRGIYNSAAGVMNALGSIVNDAINAIKRTLGIASPSRVFMGFGENMMRGLADGITGYGDLPTVGLSGVVNGLVGAGPQLGAASGGRGATVHIGQITVYARSEAEGRAGARGFVAELAERGLLPMGG